jgi:hypothetical protein
MKAARYNLPVIVDENGVDPALLHQLSVKVVTR